MVTKEQILDALRPVEDPEVHQSIVDLDMVRNIEIRGGKVSLEIVLTIRGCPLHSVIEADVRSALSEVPGVTQVDVSIGHMTDEERAAFAAKVRGQSPEAAMATPALLAPDAGVTFLAIASGKGGVGKSTVTANLARQLAQLGYSVGVIDADIYGFSLPGIFGVQEKRPTMIDNLIIPVEVDGVKLISMHYFVPDKSPVVWRGPMLGKMLRNFFGEVHWGSVDIVLLDLPPGTGDMALDVHTLLPQSKELIVTTPQEAASDVAMRAGIMGIRTHHEIIGVVENMAYFECGGCGDRHYLFGRGGGDRVAAALQTEVIAHIPIASMDQQAQSLFPNETDQGREYRVLAERVAQKLQLKTPNPVSVR